MAWLRGIYGTYPRRAAFLELLILFGVLVIHRWMVSFYHWGIYGLDLPFPQSVSDFFYWVWLEKETIQAILVALLICLIVLSNIIRRYSFAELGVRFDNLWKSGRECLAVLCILLIIAAAIPLALPQYFSFGRYFSTNTFLEDLFAGALSGTGLQFLLQGVFLVRSLQIFRSQQSAILTSAVLFSLLHTPNVKLMILTLIFGVVCCLLFLRNRNIFTLGIMHGVIQQVVRVLISSVIVSGVAYSDLGYYDYNLRVGPQRAEPEYLAELKYTDGSRKILDTGLISVPLLVENRSSVTWDSQDEENPVFVSYHLLNAEGAVVSWENILTPFRKPIEPGETVTVDLMLDAPPNAGGYYAEVDLVKYMRAGSNRKSAKTWFKKRGSKVVLVPLSTP